MVLPMGTIMASCLVLGALGMLVVVKLPRPATLTLGLVLEGAGIWNTFWYGLQHFTEFWGQMAFWSGLAMFIAGGICLRLNNPDIKAKAKPYIPILAVILGGFGAYYSWAIAQM